MVEKVQDRNLDNRAAILDESLRVRLLINEEFKTKVVAGVLGWDRAANKGLSFKEAYERGLGNAADPITNVINKFKIACSLIEDGRYGKPSERKDLVRKFIPEDHKKLSPEALEVAQALKGELNLLLIKTGDISTTSEEAREAEEYLANKFEHSKDKEDLVRAGVPIEVMGHIITLEECVEMTDERKLEEFRSWAIHTILRPYLGKLAGVRPERELTVGDLMDRIPHQVFTHPYTVRYNLIEHYFSNRLMQQITDMGLQAGLDAIENLVAGCTDQEKQSFLENIYERLFDIATYPLKGDFKREIIVKGQKKSFPSFEQRAFCYDFLQNNTRLLAADTGLGKTATFFLAMENTDAERVLVIAPAEVKEVWKEQDEVVFNNPGQTFIINKSSELDKAIKSGKKYVVISKELLGKAEKDTALFARLEQFARAGGFDGGGIDEIHNFSNPNTASAKVTKRLLEIVRENYAAKHPGKDAPIIGLTATPVRTKDLADLNVPMALLYPDRYAFSSDEATESKKTFSDTYLKNPHLTFIALIGERRMFRWEQATGVQEFSYETISTKASAFERLLCDFISTEVGVDALNKIRLIENALFNPLLVKAEVRRLVNGKIPEFDIDEVMEQLKRTVVEWKRMRGVNTPKSPEDFLSVDRLVELGLGNIVLASFFSGLLENGLDTLVDEFTRDTQDPQLQDLRTFWQTREISTKYQVLKQLLEESLAWRLDENGTLVRDKVIIISPSRMQGRTGNVLQREIVDENGQTSNLYTDYELDTINDSKLISYVRNWAQECGHCQPTDILLLDGSVPVGKKRSGVIARFTNDPEAIGMAVTLEAAYQGRDFTLNNLVDKQGRKIAGVHNIYLGPPWYHLQLKQMGGRSGRQGQLVDSRNTVLETEDSVEQGKGEAVRFTKLLTRVVLSGATLHPDDQEFFDSKRVGTRILRYRNPESNFLRDAFSRVKGVGEEETEEIMKTSANRQERTNAQIFAERFFDEGRDEYKTTGYNAEMVASLIRQNGLIEGRVLSVGAGTLLLQRKLRYSVDNVDINPHMMDAGWQVAHVFGGRIVTTRASMLDPNVFPNGTYNYVDSAFALDWSKLGNTQENKVTEAERVKILLQDNRVLAEGGDFILTLPGSALDEERLNRLVTALETNFGFAVDRVHTGKSFGVSRFGTTKRLGWCIVARKVGQPNLESLQLADLEFCTDSRRWESDYRVRQGGGNPPSQEYPTPDVRLNFNRYEIENSDGERVEVGIPSETETTPINTDIAVETTGDNVVTVEPETLSISIDLGFLKGETHEDFETYRRDLLRPLMKITGLNWTEAEEFGITTLQDIANKGRLPRNKVIAYSWILKEAKRQQSNNE